MTALASSLVTIQTPEQSVPSVPDWLCEVVWLSAQPRSHTSVDAMKGKIVFLQLSKQRMKQQEKGGVMSENHGANATTHTAARADVSRLAANDITFDEAPGCATQRATLVLGPGRAIYLGIGQSSTLHRHYATQLSISLGAPLQVRTRASGPYTAQQSFIVGPNLPHQVEMTGVPAFVLWSEARALADLAQRLRTMSATELPALPQDLLSILLPVLLASFGQVPDKQAGQALLSHVLTTLLGPRLPDEGPSDPRIATARSLVTPQFLSEQPQPITSLATRVHLSPSRFRHLFRREMGMSVQSYLRWQRLLAALRTSAYGASLTEAAHMAGFADSAHLTRVCRATFGIPPSPIFKHSRAVQVIPGAGC